jgi:hypothetical protein
MTRRCEVLWFRVPRRTWNRTVRYVTSAHPRFARGAVAWKRDVQPGAGAGDWSGQTPATTCAPGCLCSCRRCPRRCGCALSTEVFLGRRFVRGLGGSASGALRVIDPLVGVAQDSFGLLLGVVASGLLLLGQELGAALDPSVVGWLAHARTVAIPTPLMPPRGIGAVDGGLYPRGLELTHLSKKGCDTSDLPLLHEVRRMGWINGATMTGYAACIEVGTGPLGLSVKRLSLPRWDSGLSATPAHQANKPGRYRGRADDRPERPCAVRDFFHE